MAKQNKTSKIVSEFKKYLQAQASEDNKLENEQWNSFLLKFMQTGETKFQYATIVFNQEKLVSVSIANVLASYSNLKIAESIVAFSSKPSAESYNTLLNAYYLQLLTFMTSVATGSTENLYLESDAALFYIITSVYFPDVLDKVESCVLKQLAYLENERNQNIREMQGSYGRDNVLYLAHYIAKHYNRSSHAEDILKYCKPNIANVYQVATDNILSANEEIVLQNVNELAAYHIEHSKTTDLTYPFHVDYWIYFPIEIIVLLLIRKRAGLSIDHIQDPLLQIMLPYIVHESPVQLDENTRSLRTRVVNLMNDQ